MIVIPAIDMKDGKCVRLRQGRMEDATIFSDDPVAMASQWVDQGARRLHLVDLDGAFKGRPVNAVAINRIAAAHPELPIQIGGGIRDIATAKAYIDAGVRWVIIGTKAVEQPEFVAELSAECPGHVIVGLDAKGGKVATDGWAEVSGTDVRDLARDFQNAGASAIVYTDIARDGMLEGANVNATAALADVTTTPVIASGGVRDNDDIRALCEVQGRGIAGVIVGRSIYEGTLDLASAQTLADELSAS